MTTTLFSYLLQNKSLSIPGLGTIMVERVPAQNDFVHRRILSPTYHFRFDKYFDAPDKAFFSFLATQERLADHEAIRQYNEWAFTLRTSLRAEQPVSLGSLGTMLQDASGEITFKPCRQINDFFQSVAAQRIENLSLPEHPVEAPAPPQEQAADAALAADFYPEQETVKEYWRWYVVGMATLLVLLLLFHFIRKGWTIDATGLQPLW